MDGDMTAPAGEAICEALLAAAKSAGAQSADASAPSSVPTMEPRLAMDTFFSVSTACAGSTAR
mgnify:CR=1 FL=1